MNDQTPPKKAHTQPELKTWGSLTDLTKSAWAGMDVDMKSCSAYGHRGGHRRYRRRQRHHKYNSD